MKTASFIAALLLVGAMVSAEPSASTAHSSLPQLRKDYIASLKQLLQQNIDSHQFAGAAAVCQELGKVDPGARKSSSSRSPVGLWRWADGESTTTFSPDGSVANGDNKGVWHWVGESRQQLLVHWRDGTVDTVSVSPDAGTLQARNNRGEEFTAHRLPPAQE